MVKLVGKVKVPPLGEEIRWLVVADETLEGQGVSVFLHESLSEPCKYDHWFQTIGEAYEFAEENYGIRPHDWQTADSLKAQGIEIVDER
jgi:hypothetical protein